MHYKKWYVEKSTKFLGTVNMFIDAGKDPYGDDVYLVEMPYEVSILNKYNPTKHKIVFKQEPEFDEERKTVVLHIEIETITEEHKQKVTESFKEKFKEELSGVYNIFDRNIPFIYHRDDKKYIMVSPVITVVMCYILLGKIQVSISEQGTLNGLRFLEGNYTIPFKDETGDIVLLQLSNTEMDTILENYRKILEEYINSIGELYTYIGTYQYDDINRILGGLQHLSTKQ